MTTTVTRIYHPWFKWECYKAGFFAKEGDKKKQEEKKQKYITLLSNLDAFAAAMRAVLVYWPYSCEHNLTNEGLNRIAWLGQASAAYSFGACAEQTRGAFHLLSQRQQDEANALAKTYLDFWLTKHVTPDPLEIFKCQILKNTATT
jgi:hypothetical protein